MGYQIQYGTTVIKKYVPDHKRRNRFSLKVFSLFLGIVILCSMLLSKRDAVINMLLPGDSQVTKAAITNMVSKLKSGEPLAASVEAFCLEIIHGANVPQ